MINIVNTFWRNQENQQSEWITTDQQSDPTAAEVALSQASSDFPLFFPSAAPRLLAESPITQHVWKCHYIIATWVQNMHSELWVYDWLPLMETEGW